ncbi:hypothetical protein YC2023_051590 [Brassica napus]
MNFDASVKPKISVLLKMVWMTMPIGLGSMLYQSEECTTEASDHLRFLREVYNYEHVDSSVIFETLYLTLSYGHGTSEQEVLDPPEDFFRVRMVVILLETCGHYFDRGSSSSHLHHHHAETKEEIGEEMYD